MNICPTCNKEYPSYIEVCPKDGTTLGADLEEETGAFAEDEAVEAASGEPAENAPENVIDDTPEAEVEEEIEAASEDTAEDSSEAEEETRLEAAAEDSDGDGSETDEEVKTASAAASAAPAGRAVTSQSDGMSTMGKATIIILIVLAVGAGLVFWKSKVGGHGSLDLSGLTEKEMQVLVRDFNPMQLKALAENPEQKERIVEGLRERFAIASQAQKEGLADKPEVRSELESMRETILAINYDQKINADKGPMPPFGFISEDRVKEFWGETGGESPQPAAAQPNANTNANAANAQAPQPAPAPTPEQKDQGFLTSALDVVGLGWITGNADARRHEAKFKNFIDNKIKMLRDSGQVDKEFQLTEDQLKQVRTDFAKSQIYYEEAEDKLASIGSLPESERKEWEEFEEEVELQVKLQQVNFLVQTYAREKLAKKVQVSEEEVQKYIADHPEITNEEEKRKKAEDLIKRINEGADFAELAKEFSEDPGSKDNGGLYEDISKGQFVPEFESAALALEPGQVTKEPVKTAHGFHVIKLEKKEEKTGDDGQPAVTYNARHILISTRIKDPEDPMARELPVEQFVRQKLEKEKQEKVLEEIKKNNPVNIPADFKVPEPSAEDIEQMRKQQEEQMRQMLEQQNRSSEGSGDGPATAAPPPPRPAANNQE
ncbi:MAG: peptidylprolyl isomerase [Acidobacteriota bacterium]|nr:MAG: peptidylprolyl isomerase [Acidobacteriota bacterium]